MDDTSSASASTPATALRVLVLQGGGALGSYQAGAFQALCRQGFEPEWVAGISIGAINAAIIAGNPPETRLDRLKEFWEMVSKPVPWNPVVKTDRGRSVFNETSAALIATFGVPGFFTPRIPPAPLWPPGSPEAQSYYDTAPLKRTLERLVDFDRIKHAGDTRLSVGAVNARTGHFAYFDSAKIAIRPEHVMASGALPPGFPPIEIDGEYYWDGGLFSNTPLESLALASGTYTLHVYDWYVAADNGSLVGWEVCFDAPAAPLSYCTAGTTTNGCTASISASANPSASFATPCTISVSNVEGGKSGLIFYSISGGSAAPWNGASTLCVKAPTQRTPTQNSGGAAGTCAGALSLDWNAFRLANPGALGNPFNAGAQVWAQAWFRDPPAPKTTNLSDALEFTFVP